MMMDAARGVPWSAVFGNCRPVEVEIGPGRGDVLLAFARARPETNFFGIEHQRGPAEAIALRAERMGLANVRVIAADARCVVARLLPPDSVAAYHLYFPDPWPKTRHRGRRLFDPAFTTALARTLIPEGRLHIATDLASLFAALRAAAIAADLVPAEPGPLPARPPSRFERKYALQGAHAASFARRQPAAAAAPGSPRPQNTS